MDDGIYLVKSLEDQKSKKKKKKSSSRRKNRKSIREKNRPRWTTGPNLNKKAATDTDTYLAHAEECLHLNLRWFHYLWAPLDILARRRIGLRLRERNKKWEFYDAAKLKTCGVKPKNPPSACQERHELGIVCVCVVACLRADSLLQQCITIQLPNVSFQVPQSSTCCPPPFLQ